jgi:hypothetical protein
VRGSRLFIPKEVLLSLLFAAAFFLSTLHPWAIFAFMRWSTLAVLLVLVATAPQAQIYKWIMPDGSVKYSDQPQESGAEPVELPPLQTYTPQPVPKQTVKQTPKPEAVTYDVFNITAPAEGGTIRDNAGNFSVEFEVRPGLATGHSIEVFMDGQSLQRSRQGEVRLTNVSRGTHWIYGVIVDESDAEFARSKTVTVHLQRAAVAGRRRPVQR